MTEELSKRFGQKLQVLHEMYACDLYGRNIAQIRYVSKMGLPALHLKLTLKYTFEN